MHARTLAMLMCGLAACALVACDDAQTPAPQPPSPPPASTAALTAEQLTALNRGAGLMGTFAFTEAEAAFAELARELAGELGPAHPLSLDVRLDQGLAMLNQTSDGAQERALAIFDEVLQARPDDVRAQYAAGLGELFLGEPEQALPRFRAAADADPKDPYAAYYVGQCLEFANQFEAALDWYQRAIALDPYLRSPLLGLQRTLGRLGRKAEADAALASFQKLADNPRSRLAEFKYTRMGTKSEVVVPTIARAAAPLRTGELFEEVSIDVEGTPDWRPDGDAPNVTVVDMDHDGRLDLFAANTMRGGTNGVFIASGDRAFRFVADHPLAGITQVRCALWGDFDNDGLVDVYLCRNGANMLWRQAPRGVWSDVTESTGTAGGERDTIDGAFADLDHDGDLDLYLANDDGANELLTNNLDGTFRAIGTASGAAGNGKPMRQVLITDMDGDRDADILLVHADDSVEVLLNDRLWRYTPLVHALANALELTSVVAADLEATGATTLVGLARDTALVLAHADGDRWTVARPAPLPVGADSDRALAVLDITGDGEPSVIAHTPKGFAVFTRRGRPVTEVPAPAKGTVVRAWAMMTRTLRGPSIVCVTDEGLAMLDPGTARGAFATLEFSGRTDPSQSMRSNTSGIGTAAAARIGGSWVAFDTFRSTSVAGQSLQPIAVGLGDAPQVDYVSIDWSDGVFQSELALAAAARHTIVETQRQISSCPVIFAWDGDAFRFVTDCLGVGGLGYLVGMTRGADGRGYVGEYAPPRPWERVLLPGDLALAPRDGVYEFRLGEPMEEACYLDAARLVQYELPEGWSMTIDERMGIAEPLPTGEPRFYRESIAPMQAHDSDGVDVFAAIATVDGVAAPLPNVDSRFIGYLRGPHTITLEFDRALDTLPGTPTLVAHGWVEYPYGQTNFAAWQAGAVLAAPDLEGRGADGQWHRLHGPWGYPAGMPREISLMLPPLPPGTDAIRLTSTHEIYWDAFRVVGAEPCPDAVRTELPLAGAEVADGGFALRIPQPQKRPSYEYARRAPLWDTRHQDGFYTAFGGCTPLIAATDDAVAIVGPGEELRLSFSAARTPQREGWSRRFVLELDGWCKDMDLFTRDGEQLAPLPSREPLAGDALDARDRLHRDFNTRYRDGR